MGSSSERIDNSSPSSQISRRNAPPAVRHCPAGVIRATSALSVLLLVAAGGSDATAQQLYPRIINGFAAADGEFESVGIVGSQYYGVGYCSGTLISPVHVLTAAHCLAPLTGPTDGTFEIGGRIYTTEHVYAHPDYDSRRGVNDIAILELSQPVTNVTVSPIFQGLPAEGDTLTIVGFGGRGTPGQGTDGSFGVKVFGFTTIDLVTDTQIIWQFDNQSESNTAPGDSGGPGLLYIGGLFYVASIASAGTQADAALGDIAYNTRVDAYAAWIDSIVQLATDVDDGVGDGNGSDGPDDGDTDDPDDGDTDDPDDGTDSQMSCPAAVAGNRPGHVRPPRRGHRKGQAYRPGSRRPAGPYWSGHRFQSVSGNRAAASPDRNRSARSAYTTFGPPRVRSRN